VGSCKETALYLAFFAERNALQQKDQNRDSRLKRYCYFSATSKPCLAQLVKLRTAFKSYSSAEAVRSRDFSKYTELSTAYGLYSSAGFEENAKIAFVNLPLNAYTGLVDILVIGKRAKEGDPEALLQLDLIVANFQQSVLHPIDSISTSIKGRLEEADRYEANGDINRAQQIRSSIFIEATLSVTGVFATSKMIFNFPEGRFGVGAEGNTENGPNAGNLDMEFGGADPHNPLATTDPSLPNYRRSRDPSLALEKVKNDLDAAGLEANNMNAQQLMDMMWDPDTKKYNPTEIVQAQRLQHETGIVVTGRADKGYGDITTSEGNVDLMGVHENPDYFNLDSFNNSIGTHVNDKAEGVKTAVDMTNVPSSQRQNVLDYISEQNLGDEIIIFGD
jgi:hypothetical protein